MIRMLTVRTFLSRDGSRQLFQPLRLLRFDNVKVRECVCFGWSQMVMLKALIKSQNHQTLGSRLQKVVTFPDCGLISLKDISSTSLLSGFTTGGSFTGSMEPKQCNQLESTGWSTAHIILTNIVRSQNKGSISIHQPAWWRNSYTEIFPSFERSRSLKIISAVWSITSLVGSSHSVIWSGNTS